MKTNHELKTNIEICRLAVIAARADHAAAVARYYANHSKDAPWATKADADAARHEELARDAHAIYMPRLVHPPA